MSWEERQRRGGESATGVGRKGLQILDWSLKLALAEDTVFVLAKSTWEQRSRESNISVDNSMKISPPPNNRGVSVESGIFGLSPLDLSPL